MTDTDDTAPKPAEENNQKPPGFEPEAPPPDEFLGRGNKKKKASKRPPKTQVEEQIDAAIANSAVQKQRKIQRKKRIKYIGAGAGVLILGYGIVAGLKPFQATMAYGICRVFLENTVRYPEYLRLSTVEEFETSVRIWYTQIDSFGEYRMQRIQCYYKDDEKLGTILDKVKIDLRDVDAKKIEDFNRILPVIMAYPPELAYPEPLPDSLQDLQLDTNKIQETHYLGGTFMEYRTLGRTGLTVSLIGLGTMTWGRQNTESEGHAQMDYALTQGINFFDTAEMYAVPPNAQTYGTTETIIGTWFAARKNRDKVILASKIAGGGLPWVRGGAGIDRANIFKATEDSLKRLQTDYIDLYQLHWPNREDYHFGNFWNYEPNFDKQDVLDNFLEVLEALNDLVKAGKIRHVGLSNETAWGAMEYLRLAEKHNLPRMASIQNEYSLLCRRFDHDLSEIAIHEDCGLLAWSPLCRGILSGKYLGGARPPGARLSIETRQEHRDGEQTNAAVQSYLDVAKKHGLDVCQMALAFVNSRPFVTSNLIGATTMEQLKTNIDSINLKLSDDVFADIEKIRRRYPVPY